MHEDKENPVILPLLDSPKKQRFIEFLTLFEGSHSFADICGLPRLGKDNLLGVKQLKVFEDLLPPRPMSPVRVSRDEIISAKIEFSKSLNYIHRITFDITEHFKRGDPLLLKDLRYEGLKTKSLSRFCDSLVKSGIIEVQKRAPNFILLVPTTEFVALIEDPNSKTSIHYNCIAEACRISDSSPIPPKDWINIETIGHKILDYCLNHLKNNDPRFNTSWKIFPRQDTLAESFIMQGIERIGFYDLCEYFSTKKSFPLNRPFAILSNQFSRELVDQFQTPNSKLGRKKGYCAPEVFETLKREFLELALKVQRAFLKAEKSTISIKAKDCEPDSKWLIFVNNERYRIKYFSVFAFSQNNNSSQEVKFINNGIKLAVPADQVIKLIPLKTYLEALQEEFSR